MTRGSTAHTTFSLHSPPTSSSSQVKKPPTTSILAPPLSPTATIMLFFLLLLLLLPSPSLSTSFSSQELHLLLQTKLSLSDPSGFLSGWDPLKNPSFCNWTGIACSSFSSVVSVSLSSLSLSGPFPSSLCRLPSLSSLSLSFNFLSSSLPSASLLPCPSLSFLDLSQNLLVGPLPSSLALLPSLTYLDLSGNNFSGSVPRSFAAFPRLRDLSLVVNLLTGPIPAFLSNVTTLRQLNLSYNPFSPSPIPPSFGELSSLETLWLAGCGLIGTIPSSLGRLSRLRNLDLSTNNLTGSIPSSLAGLSDVVQIELYSNMLSGLIPAGFGKLASLKRIDISMNQLSGTIPEDLFQAPAVDSVHLYQNQLAGAIPGSVAFSKSLTDLRLFSNRLSGPLPVDFGKHSPLVFIDLSDNYLSGEVPSGICDGGVLEELLMLDNSLSGALPESLGHCRTLTRVRLANNRLAGEVPGPFWGLPRLWLLELAGNSLSGPISSAISGATNLSKLVISSNKFGGSIPAELGALPILYEFSAANNRLTGELPAALVKLAELGKLDLHNNSLSGELPRGVRSWKKLSELNLADNGFTGSIPPELGDLPVLNYLDLSGNSLAGEVPVQLQNLKLNRFNLSNNQLSGPLPPLFLSEAQKDSFLGNPGLCRDSPELCPGEQRRSLKHHGLVWLFRSMFLLAAVILGAGGVWFYCKYRNFQNTKSSVDMTKWTLTSFHKLGFSEYEIFNCLDEDNVIGAGASGKVYKAVLSNGQAVAVKKLWGASKGSGNVDNGFDAEVATLGKIRHKNIVKLWCCCTYEDCKLLVYEYMPNGSLGDLLHSTKAGLLDWPMRYKIMLDAAEGLSYLHHDCVPAIVHRDVKSNNILLDDDFGAKVADFGVAKAVEAAGKATKSMSVIAGSCGYIAPEYAYTLRVNEKSDIYSFGVVILELVTGKLPVDPEFGEKDLVKWVCSTSEHKGPENVIDPKLDSCFNDEILKVLDIGLLCSSSLPINRPSMRRVVTMLLEVSPLSKQKPKQDGKMSPYYYDDVYDRDSAVGV